MRIILPGLILCDLSTAHSILPYLKNKSHRVSGFTVFELESKQDFEMSICHLELSQAAKNLLWDLKYSGAGRGVTQEKGTSLVEER
jgi:hypothetical protein